MFFPSQAAVAILAGQLLKVASSGTVTPCTAITDTPVGTLLVDAAAGASCSVLSLPGAAHDVIASTSVSAGDAVEPSATAGQVQPVTSGTRVGIALWGAGAGSRLKVLGGV